MRAVICCYYQIFFCAFGIGGADMDVKPGGKMPHSHTAKKQPARYRASEQHTVRSVNPYRPARKASAPVPAAAPRMHKTAGHVNKSPLPAIVLLALVLAVGGGMGWLFFWRPVDVTVNGETRQARIGSTLADYLEDNDYFGAKAGRLMSVGGNVIKEDGGKRYTLQVDGKDVTEDDAASRAVEDGDALTVANGADATEDYTESEQEVAPGIQKEVGGAVQYVSQWGKPGRKKVWTGKTSGETVDKEVLREATDMVVSSHTPKPASGKYMALTFDDGPSSYTEEILKVLADKGVKATFFNLGKEAAAKPSLAKAIVDGGHELASHTNQHQNLPTLDRDSLRSEITDAATKLGDASGTTPQMIRAPYGEFTEVEWARAGDLISCNVLWNIDTLDWKLPGAQAITSMVLNNAFNGAIVLMHDGGGNRSQDVAALPGIIDGLQKQGYTLVTVSELMSKDDRFPKDVVKGTVKMPEDAALPQM